MRVLYTTRYMSYKAINNTIITNTYVISLVTYVKINNSMFPRVSIQYKHLIELFIS